MTENNQQDLWQNDEQDDCLSRPSSQEAQMAMSLLSDQQRKRLEKKLQAFDASERAVDDATDEKQLEGKLHAFEEGSYKPQAPQKIHGWLAFFTFFAFPVSIILSVFEAFKEFSSFNQMGYELMGTPPFLYLQVEGDFYAITEIIQVLWQGGFYSELFHDIIGPLVFFFLALLFIPALIVLFILIVKKQKLARKWAIITFSLDIAVGYLIPCLIYPELITEFDINDGRSLVATIIWLLYFIFSKQVKEVLVLEKGDRQKNKSDGSISKIFKRHHKTFLYSVIALAIIVVSAVISYGFFSTYSWTKVDQKLHKETFRDVSSGAYEVTRFSGSYLCTVGQNWTDCYNKRINEYNSNCANRSLTTSGKNTCDDYEDMLDDMKSKGHLGSPYWYVSTLGSGDKLSSYMHYDTVSNHDYRPEKHHEAICWFGFLGECKK